MRLSRLPGQRRVPGPPGRLPRLPAGSPAQRLAGRRRRIRLPGRLIASLWSDIIAENPELYGTPGGLASLEAETIFLPCTSGLPGTSPAGDGGQPGEADELTAWAVGLGLEAGDLDDLVHDAYSRQASEVNNGGLGSQVRFLAGTYGTGGARSLLSDLRPAAPAAGAEQRPPSAPGE